MALGIAFRLLAVTFFEKWVRGGRRGEHTFYDTSLFYLFAYEGYYFYNNFFTKCFSLNLTF